jgi:hypothetical protein
MSNVWKTWKILRGYRVYRDSVKVNGTVRQMALCSGIVHEGWNLKYEYVKITSLVI